MTLDTAPLERALGKSERDILQMLVNGCESARNARNALERVAQFGLENTAHGHRDALNIRAGFTAEIKRYSAEALAYQALADQLAALIGPEELEREPKLFGLVRQS